MRHLIKLFIPLLVLVTFMACSNLFNQDADEPNLSIKTTQATSPTTFNGDTLIFDRINPGEEPPVYPSFTSEIKGKQLILNGYYLAPCTSVNPKGTINDEEKSITINIYFKPGDACFDQPIGFLYDAYISDLKKGTYNVSIVHKNDLMRDSVFSEHTVFTKKITIE